MMYRFLKGRYFFKVQFVKPRILVAVSLNNLQESYSQFTSIEFCKFVVGNSRIKSKQTKLNTVITVKKRKTPCFPYKEEIFGTMVSFLYSVEKVF